MSALLLPCSLHVWLLLFAYSAWQLAVLVSGIDVVLEPRSISGGSSSGSAEPTFTLYPKDAGVEEHGCLLFRIIVGNEEGALSNASTLTTTEDCWDKGPWQVGESRI